MTKKTDLLTKIANSVDRIIDYGDYSNLVTYLNLFAGEYDLDYNTVSHLLYFNERFSTALDYDTATDYSLWMLVRRYTDKNHRPPVKNQTMANHIKEKSKWLHRKFPCNRYFNKNSFRPISHGQACQLKWLIHKIIENHGMTAEQYFLFHQSFMDFIYYEQGGGHAYYERLNQPVINRI